MAKITVFDQQFKDGKPSGYKVALDDNTAGYLVEKDSDKGLKVGDVVNYTVDIPAGKTYKKLTLKLAQTTPPAASAPPPTPKPFNAPLAQVAPPKSIKELKVDAAISAMEFAFTAYCEGKIDYPKIPETQRDAVTILWKEIDEVFSE
jgi:hypothetical protein